MQVKHSAFRSKHVEHALSLRRTIHRRQQNHLYLKLSSVTRYYTNYKINWRESNCYLYKKYIFCYYHCISDNQFYFLITINRYHHKQQVLLMQTVQAPFANSKGYCTDHIWFDLIRFISCKQSRMKINHRITHVELDCYLNSSLDYSCRLKQADCRQHQRDTSYIDFCSNCYSLNTQLLRFDKLPQDYSPDRRLRVTMVGWLRLV